MMIVQNLEDCQCRAGDLFDHHFTAGAGDENQSHAALQPASPLPFSFACERVIMARSADESLHVFGRLHLCKPTEKYVCTPLAVLLSGCRLRGADLLYLAVGKEDFHSRGRGLPVIGGLFTRTHFRFDLAEKTIFCIDYAAAGKPMSSLLAFSLFVQAIFIRQCFGVPASIRQPIT